MPDLFNEFTFLQMLTLIVSAVLIGINKTAIPGIGVLPVVLLTMAFPARLSTGLQLIMLAMTDLLAVAWYRRHADWKIVLRLLPWAFAGLALGSWTLRYVSDEAMRPLLGAIVLILAALNLPLKFFIPHLLRNLIIACFIDLKNLAALRWRMRRGRWRRSIFSR